MGGAGYGTGLGGKEAQPGGPRPMRGKGPCYFALIASPGLAPTPINKQSVKVLFCENVPNKESLWALCEQHKKMRREKKQEEQQTSVRPTSTGVERVEEFRAAFGLRTRESGPGQLINDFRLGIKSDNAPHKDQ